MRPGMADPQSETHRSWLQRNEVTDARIASATESCSEHLVTFDRDFLNLLSAGDFTLLHRRRDGKRGTNGDRDSSGADLDQDEVRSPELNAKLPIAFDAQGALEVDLLCAEGRMAVERAGGWRPSQK